MNNAKTAPGPWGGFLSGLVPVGLPAAIVAGAVALAALARRLLAGQDFSTQQLTAVAIIGVGLVAAVVAYIVACRRALRRVAASRAAGDAARARAALWGIAASGLILLLPVLLALVIPQHPAP